MHRVKINLPASTTGILPDPNAPVVSIDGKPIEMVKSVTIRAGQGDGLTTVQVEFHAEVEGEISVETKRLPT